MDVPKKKDSYSKSLGCNCLALLLLIMCCQYWVWQNGTKLPTGNSNDVKSAILHFLEIYSSLKGSHHSYRLQYCIKSFHQRTIKLMDRLMISQYCCRWLDSQHSSPNFEARMLRVVVCSTKLYLLWLQHYPVPPHIFFSLLKQFRRMENFELCSRNLVS